MADELQTIITTEIEDSAIDEAITFCENFELFEEIGDIFKDIKTGVHTGASIGTNELAELDQSSQELWISMNGSIVTGNLIGNIIITQETDLSYSILPEPHYAWWVEKGRGEVRPVEKEYLHFFIDGQEMFTKYSAPAQPRPFIEPAFNYIEEKATTVIDEAINDVIN